MFFIDQKLDEPLYLSLFYTLKVKRSEVKYFCNILQWNLCDPTPEFSNILWVFRQEFQVPKYFFNILCEHSRINFLQWILTKPGTYLDLKKIWNPIDFQGQRSRSQGLSFRRGDTPRFALPLFDIVFLNLKAFIKCQLSFHMYCNKPIYWLVWKMHLKIKYV